MIDARRTMTERMCLSAMRKFNPKNAPYSYKSSILLETILKASRILGDDDMLRYVNYMLDDYVNEDGSVKTYRLEEYSMDQVRMGNLFIPMYQLTGQRKYKIAIDTFMTQLKGQPRVKAGGFWHKKRYTNQMWLDGLYMQGPFNVMYNLNYGKEVKATLDDVVSQFELIYDKTLDESTGLLRHAWDESLSMAWCDPDTGRSQEVWGRALGWYCMALADLLEMIPPVYADHRSRLMGLALRLAPVVLGFQDDGSGMWWQVMDKANVGDNYLESSGSCMFIYFFAKMHRLGFLGPEYIAAARKGFDGLIGHSVTIGADGEVFLHHTCKSAGLGRAADENPYRPADFDYYVHGEPIETDNLHGVAPFLMASLELEFPGQMNRSEYRIQKDEDITAALNAHAGKDVVVIPKGEYLSGPISVPSHSHIVFEEGAVIRFIDDFEAYPPVYTRWEGVNCYAMHPCLFMDNVTDVVVEGPGVLDGQGQKWWDYILKWKDGGRPALINLPIEKKLARLNPDFEKQPGGGGGRPCQFLRPALLQVLNSRNVRVSDLKLTQSPFWTFHPICCMNLVAKNMKIVNPYDSPNTDGMDIESCVNVTVSGCDVHVGDDGIAIKSGSGSEMMQFQRSENILVQDCTVRDAHGGFVIGSETASGVLGATVRRCRFIGTDRGLRIKTRRGRGGQMCSITASDIYMENVICPVSINMFYRCGSDEPSFYSLEKQPVDDATPEIKDILVERITARDCRSGAAFLAGLPERPLENVVFRDCEFSVTEALEPGLEAEMCRGIPETDYRGIRVINAEASFTNVKVNVDPAVKFEKL